MQGRVLVWDAAKRGGMIIGEDGVSYMFFADSLSPSAMIMKGTHVDFVAEGGVARGVVVRPEAPVRVRPESGPAAMPHLPMDSPSQGMPFHGSPDQVEPLNIWTGFKKAWRLSFSASGRASRTEYWGFALFQLLFGIGSMAVLWLLMYLATGGNTSVLGAEVVVIGVPCLFLLASIPAGLCVNIRRFHDVGLSGWFFLLTLIPYAGTLFHLIVSCIPSKQEVTRHGPPASLG